MPTKASTVPSLVPVETYVLDQSPDRVVIIIGECLGNIGPMPSPTSHLDGGRQLKKREVDRLFRFACNLHKMRNSCIRSGIEVALVA